jgi:hypothetical protein
VKNRLRGLKAVSVPCWWFLLLVESVLLSLQESGRRGEF